VIGNPMLGPVELCFGLFWFVFFKRKKANELEVLLLGILTRIAMITCMVSPSAKLQQRPSYMIRRELDHVNDWAPSSSYIWCAAYHCIRQSIRFSGHLVFWAHLVIPTHFMLRNPVGKSHAARKEKRPLKHETPG